MRVYLGRDLSDESLREVEKLIPRAHEVIAVRSIRYDVLDAEGLAIEMQRDKVQVIVTNERPVGDYLKEQAIPITAIRYRGKDDAVEFKRQFRAAERLNLEGGRELYTWVMGALGHETPTRLIEPPMTERQVDRHVR